MSKMHQRMAYFTAAALLSGLLIARPVSAGDDDASDDAAAVTPQAPSALWDGKAINAEELFAQVSKKLTDFSFDIPPSSDDANADKHAADSPRSDGGSAPSDPPSSTPVPVTPPKATPSSRLTAYFDIKDKATKFSFTITPDMTGKLRTLKDGALLIETGEDKSPSPAATIEISGKLIARTARECPVPGSKKYIGTVTRFELKYRIDPATQKPFVDECGCPDNVQLEFPFFKNKCPQFKRPGALSEALLSDALCDFVEARCQDHLKESGILAPVPQEKDDDVSKINDALFQGKAKLLEKIKGSFANIPYAGVVKTVFEEKTGIPKYFVQNNRARAKLVTHVEFPAAESSFQMKSVDDGISTKYKLTPKPGQPLKIKISKAGESGVLAFKKGSKCTSKDLKNHIPQATLEDFAIEYIVKNNAAPNANPTRAARAATNAVESGPPKPQLVDCGCGVAETIKFAGALAPDGAIIKNGCLTTAEVSALKSKLCMLIDVKCVEFIAPFVSVLETSTRRRGGSSSGDSFTHFLLREAAKDITRGGPGTLRGPSLTNMAATAVGTFLLEAIVTGIGAILS